MLRRFGRSILAGLLPTRCLLCGAPAGRVPNLCDGCLDDLPRPPPGACPVCGLPGPPGAAGGTCGACLREGGPQRATVCAFVYAPPVDVLVSRLKFDGMLAAATPLGLSLACAVRRRHGAEVPVRCVVPMPLHPDRLRERGFNQAHEIARPLARALGLALDRTLVRRTVATEAQTGLASARARRRNVAGAFTAARLPAGDHHLAVVDDVVTTAATARAVAATLLRAGASSVEIWAAARAMPPPLRSGVEVRDR